MRPATAQLLRRNHRGIKQVIISIFISLAVVLAVALFLFLFITHRGTTKCLTENLSNRMQKPWHTTQFACNECIHTDRAVDSLPFLRVLYSCWSGRHICSASPENNEVIKLNSSHTLKEKRNRQWFGGASDSAYYLDVAMDGGGVSGKQKTSTYKTGAVAMIFAHNCTDSDVYKCGDVCTGKRLGARSKRLNCNWVRIDFYWRHEVRRSGEKIKTFFLYFQSLSISKLACKCSNLMETTLPWPAHLQQTNTHRRTTALIQFHCFSCERWICHRNANRFKVFLSFPFFLSIEWNDIWSHLHTACCAPCECVFRRLSIWFTPLTS